MAQSSYDLLVKIMGDATSLNAALRDADEQTQNRFGKMQQYAQGATIALGGIALAAGLAVKSMLDQAAQMETYRTKLTTVFKDSAKAAETMRAAVEFAAKTPFEVKGIVDATVTLSVYRQKAEEILPLVGDLAAAMGARIEDTAQAVGKAMSGSLEGWEQLRNTYGVTIERLKAFGAAIDSQGQMLTKNANDLERNRKALLAVIATDFGGGMERQSKTFSGAMSNLQDSISNLQVSFGETLIPAATQAAQTISGLVGTLQKLPEPLKAAIGWSTAAGAGIAAIGAAFTGVVAILPQFIAGLQTLRTLMPSLSLASVASWGAIGVAISAATIMLQMYRGELDKAFEAQLRFEVDKTKDMAQAWKFMHEYVGMTAEELHKAGVAQTDVTAAIRGMQEYISDAKTAKQKQYYEAQLDGLRKLSIELSDFAKKRAGLDGETATREKEAEHAIKAHAGAERDLLAAQQARLDYMRTSGKSTQDEINAQEEKIAATKRKIDSEDQKRADETTKAHIKANEDKLAASLHYIDRKRSLNQMSEAEEIAALQRVLRSHQLTAEQRKGIIERMEDVAKKRSDSAREAITKNLEEERKKAEEVAQKKAEAEEKAKQARIKAAEAAAAAVTSSYDKELDAARKAAKGKIDEEVFFLQQKMKTLEAEQSKYLFGKVMYNDGKGDLSYQEDAMKYNAMEASKAKFKEAIATAQEQQEEQRRQRQVEAYRKQEEAVMGNTRKYSEEQRVRFGMEMENFYRRNGMEEEAVRLHQQVLDLQQQISDKAIEEAKVIVDGAQKSKAAREEALTLSVKELANSTEQARVLKQAADDAVRLASSVGKFMGFTAAGKWGKTEAKTSGTSTTTSKPTGSLPGSSSVESGKTYSPAAGTYTSEATPSNPMEGEGWGALSEADKNVKWAEYRESQRQFDKSAQKNKDASEEMHDAAGNLKEGSKSFAEAAAQFTAKSGMGIQFTGGVGGSFAAGTAWGGGNPAAGGGGASPRGATGGYDYFGQEEEGRWVSQSELQQLMRTEGWYQANGYAQGPNGKFWVYGRTTGQAMPQEDTSQAGFGSPINLTANFEHRGGATSPFDVSTTDTGSTPATFHQGRTGVSPSTAGAATSQQEITINVPLYVDSAKVGGAVASKTLAQGFGTTSWDNMAAFS